MVMVFTPAGLAEFTLLKVVLCLLGDIGPLWVQAELERTHEDIGLRTA